MSELNPDSTPLSRVDLLRLAQSLGVSDADVMTRAELRAAIDKARRPDPLAGEQPSTTWVSVARRLLASVVERGLNLPDAAALIRGDTKLNTPPKAPPPVATVTLARIYAAQGHLDRAIGTLKEVLESDPDHDLASELRAQLETRRAETLARASAAKAALSDDPGVSADSVPPASTVSDGLEPVLEQATAPSPAVLAALVSELAATAPESEAPPTEAGPFAPAPDLSTEPAGPATRAGALGGEWPAAPLHSGVNGVTADLPARDPSRDELSSHDVAPPFIVGGFEPASVASTEQQPPSVPPPPYLSSSDSSASSDIAPSSDSSASSDIAPSYGTAPEHAESKPTPPPPAPISVDVAAELVAPAFATIERDASSLAAAETLSTSDAVSTGAVSAEAVSPEAMSAPAVWASEVSPESASAETMPARAAPAEARPAQAANGVVNGAAFDAPAASTPKAGEPSPPPALPPKVAPPSAPIPQAPGLLLIETDTPVRYVYWELSAPDPSRPHWIHVVIHTPTPGGSAERRERSFPVHRPLGALRLEGLPADAVVRARLTQAANDGRALVVASSVRPAAGADAFEVRYAPQLGAKPDAIAHRARPQLEHASPVYWD